MSPSIPRLSICIATRNRSHLLAQALENIAKQLTEEVEVVIVDGASTDGTADVAERMRRRSSAIRYFPQAVNSGIDGDFDKAVELSRGEYCWPMSDDDMLKNGAIVRVLALLESNPSALVVDVEVRSDDLAELLVERRLPFRGVRTYTPAESDRFFAECAAHLTYIGGAIVQRATWLARNRRAYYGTEFIHAGVIFQAPFPREVAALGEPLVALRYGVASWKERSFQVWMFTWPELIWSFSHIPAAIRERVTPAEPWRSLARLLLFRAKGWYSWKQYCDYIRPKLPSAGSRSLFALVALVPGTLLNTAALMCSVLFARSRKGGLYDLRHSRYCLWRQARE